MIYKNYNPDVLVCLANLSSDEVFTPPKVVNQILDLLPSDIWANKNITFFDPCTKSGVFLREIVKRLNIGLSKSIPNLESRLKHILTNQVYGLAITELTALLSRRSLYCSKIANGKYSIIDSFDNESGNIRYNKILHTWSEKKCIFCGIGKNEYDRSIDLDNYAYEFIHNKNPDNIFKMKFDVIIGNPPYQLSDGGFGKSASPIYNKFVEQAKKLNPKYLSMIIPARWYSSGKGLDEFRNSMLNDRRISKIFDFPETSDCFPSLNIRGGVCYFLWDRDYNGKCEVNSMKGSEIISSKKRYMNQVSSDVFVRYNQAIDILDKVNSFKEKKFDYQVSSRKPFGLPTNFDNYSKTKSKSNELLLYRFGNNGYVSVKNIIKNHKLINQFKVLVPKASPGGDNYPHQVFTYPTLSYPGSVCTETYIVIGGYDSKEIALNVMSYICTSFFRFLVLLIKNTQDVPKGVYAFVPDQDFSNKITDDYLYQKYKVSKSEINFINSLIKKMEFKGEL